MCICVGVPMDRKWVDEWTDGYMNIYVSVKILEKKQAAPIFTNIYVFSSSVDSQNCYFNLLYF
jgi:hypothetical protein